MIKIRYADLPEGLHARAEAEGRGAVIYLVRGLSPDQRRAALRRVRREARLGNGPRLSASGVALAVARDTAKSTTRNGIAAVRFHPAGSLFLTALLASTVVCYVLFVSVSIHLIPIPPTPGALTAPGGAGPGGAPGQRYSASSQGSQQVSGPGPAPTAATRASAHASAGASGAGSTQHAASPVPLPSSSSAPPASPSPNPTGAAPTPSPSGSSPGGLCVNVGPLGVCLSVHA
ncbi:MAG TPA: hypothetical protein VII22_11095 [Streptosporangiaceae bacterium]